MAMTFRQKIEESKKLITNYINTYPDYGVAVSWGKDSTVLLDLVIQLHFEHSIKIFSVLANTEFNETLKIKEILLKRYENKITYKEYVFLQPENYGDECCKTSKVIAFKLATQNLDCWFSGARRDEGLTRQNMDYVENKNGLIKVNPILDFTEKDIYRYLAINNIPVNPLYLDYRSLSCQYCSAKEQDENEPERAGRWVGSEVKECGIHTQSLR
jgi:phosphoadenosine phosphosulfate reductase